MERGELTGKVAIVTGSATGIGSATAIGLARHGAQVVVNYSKSKAEADKTADTILSNGGKVLVVQGDVAHDGDCRRIADEAIKMWGRIDVLVNNAGVAIESSIDDPLDAWRAAWDTTWRVNVVALADLCREAILHFRSRGGGTIINISSRAAFRGDSPHYMHYAASKGAVVALTKSIARGYARDGVLAYGVAPGWVATDMARQSIQMVGLEKLVQDIPMGTMAPPQDVANVVAFLASGLAPHATGTTIDVNGASYVR